MAEAFIFWHDFFPCARRLLCESNEIVIIQRDCMEMNRTEQNTAQVS